MAKKQRPNKRIVNTESVHFTVKSDNEISLTSSVDILLSDTTKDL
jgi:hypothetical protein